MAQGKREMPHWEPLSKTCRVLVSPVYGFTTDTLLLAHFSMPEKGENCADIGTGCGVIPLLWRLRGKAGKIYGAELQEEAAALARESVKENGFQEDIEILWGDARNRLFGHESLGLMACNPPYQPLGAGLRNPEPGREAARHELTLTLEDLAEAARYALAFGGRLCLCLRPFRLAQAMALFSGKGLEPKRLRLVQPRAEKAPSLFLLECRKGGKTGLSVEPTLLIENEKGFSREMLEIYGDYRA